jgi:broad specificity phosphatase PhoE
VPVSHQLSELRERNYGSLDGSPIDDYNAVKQANRAKLSDLGDNEKWLFKHAPDIESDDELSFRFLNAITAIAEGNLGKTILVAAHGGVLRTTLIRLGYATTKQLPSQSVENAAFVELRYENSKFTIGQLSGINRRAN